MSNKIKGGGMHAKRVTGDIITYIFLIVLSVIWLIPFFWLVMQSFRDGKGQFISTFLPKAYTVNNYKALFTQFDVMNFPRMFMNTFFIACCTCVISTFFVLSVAYCTSRLKWKMRKPYMNMAMILNLFPGFMTMIAVYFILKALGMTEGNRIPLALIICFSSGSGTGFFVMKGFMDTIPKALDEAATLDGCTRWQIFTKITLPLSKPMIVYQIITSFMAPWVDFVFAKVICRTNSQYFTVSIGLWSMLEKEYVDTWFVRFCAGAVLVSIPIAILFMIGIPVVVCFIYDVMPTFSEVFTTAIGLLAVYVPTALSEVISYTPMLGTACYITFITGNVGNMKIPCALNAMEMTDSPLGTERGDTVSAIAVSVSSMVTMIVIAIGVVLLVPLQPILENPTVQVATSYMLPALFGSMVVTNVANSKSGEYRIKNRILTMLAPMACIIAFDYLVMPIKGKEGYTMIVTIPLTILLAYIMYKLGIVKVEKED